MRKIALVTFSLLLISTLGLIFNITLIKAHPETIYVDDDNITGPWVGTPEHPYKNITSGLAHASPGDTVYVYNGTYYEQLTIDKPVSLTGENKFTTIFDGSNIGNVIEITANNVNITHFTIQNSRSTYAFGGIHADHSSGNNISCNIIINNWNGIRLEHSSNNVLTDNDVSNNMEGIYLINSSNNILTNNKILNNDFGMVLRNSNNSIAFHNSFINNSWKSISSTDSANSWNNGAEGNYWSDYTGKDEDQDGIGDSPYIISANNIDNYPLMGTFSDFIIIYENETHHVLTLCNSTISQFQYNETLRTLTYNVTGINNTTGFCRITIPEQLTHKPHIVLINDEQVNATSLPISNSTHTYLYFTYNHTPQEVKILSKPYYELWEKYTTLLEDYRNLNSVLDQLQDDYELLNQTHWQLNQTFWEYFQMNLTTENLARLNHNYQETLANYTTLQNDYNSIQTDYNDLLEQYNSLNSNYTKIESEYANTQITLWCVSATAVAITVIITSSLTIKYGKRSKEQKKLLEKYKSELERISLLDIARTQFETDVQRRKEKIEKFKKKYGITVRPRNTLEDVIRSLELKKKKED